MLVSAQLKQNVFLTPGSFDLSRIIVFVLGSLSAIIGFLVFLLLLIKEFMPCQVFFMLLNVVIKKK